MFEKPASFFKRENIKGFIQGHIREIKKEYNSLPEDLIEQAAWRLTQIQKNSPKCYEDKVCKKCGCEFPSKAFEDRPCEGNCYPPMMNKIDWEKFKNNNYAN